MSGFAVGQEIIEVITHNQRNGAVINKRTITKIGRKWVHYGGRYDKDKFHIKNGYIDGGDYTSPGKCFLSMDDYIKEQEFKFYQKAFSDNFSTWSTTIDAPLENIKKAAELLNLDLGVFITPEQNK